MKKMISDNNAIIGSFCAGGATSIIIPEHFSTISLIHKSLREQTLNLQIGPCHCGESHWGLLARPLNSTFCNPPIWLHSRWVEVCDLLRQFCAWLPWPVLVWHLLLLVGLYPDLHTGLVYSCLAGKCKHTLEPLAHTDAHITHLQSPGKSGKKKKV